MTNQYDGQDSSSSKTPRAAQPTEDAFETDRDELGYENRYYAPTNYETDDEDISNDVYIYPPTPSSSSEDQEFHDERKLAATQRETNDVLDMDHAFLREHERVETRLRRISEILASDRERVHPEARLRRISEVVLSERQRERERPKARLRRISQILLSDQEEEERNPEEKLKEITDLLLGDKDKQRHQGKRQKKRQVAFFLTNYFALFLSLIAISAEIQSRAPRWMQIMEDQVQRVNNCATNEDTLIACVRDGDFAGFVASILLWLSRSVATRHIFLFGFESPMKLWSVVYESLITAVCWGTTYLFIRRGMNPDTRERFFRKFWKDAVYGSLAAFNAAFMKHVFKNLIPQEAVERHFQEAIQERRFRLPNWLIKH